MKKYFCKATRGALALSSVGLIAGAVTLHAGDDLSGFYVGADAGYNLESDLTASDGSFKYSVQSGVRADGTLGYAIKLTHHLSIAPELEGGIIYNSMNKLTSGTESFSGTGSVTQVPIMGNAVLRWHFCHHWTVYGGGGAGCDFNTFKFSSAPLFNIQQSEDDFAWQVLGGIKYKLGRSELGLGYTYLSYNATGLKAAGNNTIFASYTFNF